MKTGSKVLIVLAVVVSIVAAGLFLLIFNLDAIVEAAIEKYGSKATGTDVEVSTVKIKLKAGEGLISGLSIGNPSGFSAPSAFDLEDITIVIDSASIAKDPVVIDKVVVSAPRITYEINESGEANIGRIRKNVQLYGEQSKPSEKGKAEGGKKLMIRSLVIEGGEVDVRVAARPDKPLSAKLPRIHLKNVGGESGAAPGDIALQILKPLVNGAAQAAARTGVEQYLGKNVEEVEKMLQEGAQEKLGTKAEEAAKGAEGAVKKLFGR